jgi:hypothetical protein
MRLCGLVRLRRSRSPCLPPFDRGWPVPGRSRGSRSHRAAIYLVGSCPPYILATPPAPQAGRSPKQGACGASTFLRRQEARPDFVRPSATTPGLTLHYRWRDYASLPRRAPATPHSIAAERRSHSADQPTDRGFAEAGCRVASPPHGAKDEPGSAPGKGLEGGGLSLPSPMNDGPLEPLPPNPNGLRA